MSDACSSPQASLIDCSVPLLCDLEGNEWEEHPKYELTGEGNSVATKGASLMYSPWHDWDSTLVTNRVMDSGIHRISLIYTVPTKETISTMMGFEVGQLGTNFLSKPPRNFVSAVVDRYSMALFGVVPDCFYIQLVSVAAPSS